MIYERVLEVSVPLHPLQQVDLLYMGGSLGLPPSVTVHLEEVKVCQPGCEWPNVSHILKSPGLNSNRSNFVILFCREIQEDEKVEKALTDGRYKLQLPVLLNK